MDTLLPLLMLAAPGLIGALFGAVFSIFLGGPTRRRVVRGCLLGAVLVAGGFVTIGGLLIGAAPWRSLMYFGFAATAVLVAAVIGYATGVIISVALKLPNVSISVNGMA